jgi:hypothetical protein
MSRAILVRVSESIVQVVHVEDGVQAPLEMLPILATERMAELLATELEGIGFQRDGMIARRTEPDGIEVEIDLARATVTVKLGANQKVEEEVELESRVYAGGERQARENLRDQAVGELEERVAEKTEELRKKVTKQLEGRLADIKKELDGAIGRATVAALTERAGQLGKIESVLADQAGNVTIRVKV